MGKEIDWDGLTEYLQSCLAEASEWKCREGNDEFHMGMYEGQSQAYSALLSYLHCKKKKEAADTDYAIVVKCIIYELRRQQKLFRDAAKLAKDEPANGTAIFTERDYGKMALGVDYALNTIKKLLTKDKYLKRISKEIGESADYWGIGEKK